MVLSISIQGSAMSVVQSGEVKLRQRQSSPVRCSAVQFSLLKCCPAQSSPVQSTPPTCTPVQFNPVQSIKWSLFQSRPVQIYSFPSNSSHSLPPKYISILDSPGPYKSTAVESGPVKWSAICPHLSPYKCISVLCCLQLSHQHNQERLLTALS